MSMRSTKDLKDIVHGARAKSKNNGIRGEYQDINASTGIEDNEYSFNIDDKSGKYNTNVIGGKQ